VGMGGVDDVKNLHDTTRNNSLTVQNRTKEPFRGDSIPDKD